MTIGAAISGAIGIGTAIMGKGKKIPGPAAVLPPQDYIDNIFGTSVKEVNGPNGKQTVIDRTLSAADQAKLDSLNQMYSSYLGDLESLTSIASAMDIPEFQPVLQATRENQRLAREDAYKQRASLEENTLARRGVADSTTASDVRQLRGQELTRQASQDERDLILMSEQLRDNALARTGNGLNFVGNQIQQDKTNALNSTNMLLGNRAGMFSAANGAQAQNYQQQVGAIQANNQQNQQFWSDIGGSAGFLAGSFGGGSGGGVATAGGTSRTSGGFLYANPVQGSAIQWNRY